MSNEAMENLKQSCIDDVMMYTDEDLIREFELEGAMTSPTSIDLFRDRLIDRLFQARLEEAS